VARQKRLFADHNTSLRSLQDAEAQLAAAETQLALLQVTAPLSGTVTHVSVRPGEAVDLNTVLADITDLHRLVVAANIPSAEASKLHLGQQVQVLTDPPVLTALAYVSAAVDATNDTVSVRAPLPPGSALRLGQLVPLRIVTAEQANCLAAPAASVVTDVDGRSAVAIVAGDEATHVVVKTGLREDGLVAIDGPGLKEGDTVVTVGAYGLPAKTKVQVLSP
jgi:RND family efflux transporter MFP subunit